MSEPQPLSRSSRSGSARDVLDWLAWLEHNVEVQSLCDSLDTAMAVFGCFKQSASAKRGSYLTGVRTYG